MALCRKLPIDSSVFDIRDFPVSHSLLSFNYDIDIRQCATWTASILFLYSARFEYSQTAHLIIIIELFTQIIFNEQYKL
jgi:hypothetical protein